MAMMTTCFPGNVDQVLKELEDRVFNRFDVNTKRFPGTKKRRKKK